MSKFSSSLALLVVGLVVGLVFFQATGTSTQCDIESEYIHIGAQSTNDLTNISVALYESYYSSTDLRISESRGALYNMLTWMNATVNIINQTDILDGALWAHELLVIPEGLGPWIERNIGDEGMQMIRDWLSAGGSYIGVRGSATMAVTDSYFEGSNTTFALGLFNGTSLGMADLGHTLMTDVEINRDCTGPDLSDMPETMSTLFRTGRYFVADPGQEIIVIARYTYNDLPAMIATHYGEGTVFLSSPHFEYEENGDLDGTDYMDRYDDPDSEWAFMLRITQWFLADSPTVLNATTWPIPIADELFVPTEMLLAVGGLGVVVIIAILVFVKKS